MIKVGRRCHIEGVTPEQVFTTLSDPSLIGQILPRVQKTELYDRDDIARHAKLVTHMSMGGLFGTIRCEGDLTWQDNREIVFTVRTPLPVETRWVISPAINGTDVQVVMGIDLKPILGAMAAFVPEKTVADMLGSDLETALRGVARQTRQTVLARAAA
ncbi:SRPBCC family protein [Chloroflexus sp. Y-396-1]|uniref:SRPBCC family protein n=1 Tax=Chloroflexus sp. Y-396-1 TaxID=867845 RepID=UPI0004917F2D|nr:SRPBCC family protein [Chloroflexus sp. Y-396-1]